jgi:hypothetical protein
MRLDTLGTVVSLAGIVFFAAALVIVVLGKKVGDGTGPQRIKVGKFVDLETNSVLTLCLIALVPAIAPLALNYWKPDLKYYVAPDDLSRSYLALKDLSVSIYGSVLLEGGGFADDVGITIVRTGPTRVDTLHTETDQQGQFLIQLDRARPKEHYIVTWRKAGYAPKTLRFGFNEIPFPLVLTKAAEQ